MGLETIREALEDATTAIQHKEEVKNIVEALRNSGKNLIFIMRMSKRIGIRLSVLQSLWLFS